MNTSAAREVVADYIRNLTGRHRDLDDTLARLELPDDRQGGTKAERLDRCVSQLPDDNLRIVAEAILERGDPQPGVRNRLQDLLWSDLPPAPELSLRARRELADAFPLEQLYLDWDGFYRLLDELWVLDTRDESGPDWPFPPPTVRTGIEQHVLHNQDWSTIELFDKLGALRSSDRRFALFLQGLAGNEVLPDESRQRWFVDSANEHLRAAGVELQQNGVVDGYPTFLLTGQGQALRRPKQVIFAAVGRKPDLRLSSTIDNDVDIRDGADRVLAYTRPIGADGLTWSALQQWRAAESEEPDEHIAKAALYSRLVRALPASSPPQYEFFAAYHRVFSRHTQHLPALLPEVWFCWDPKSVAVRGRDALLHSRMDFLLFLPGPQRTVIEVDGPQHYITDDGRPARSAYRNDVTSDRELTLSGYRVYRFSTDELGSPEQAERTVEKFFRALYLPYRLLDP